VAAAGATGAMAADPGTQIGDKADGRRILIDKAACIGLRRYGVRRDEDDLLDNFRRFRCEALAAETPGGTFTCGPTGTD
jgi:hypothetical protein